MLYEVGSYINPVGRHRHAYYVISQSELFGFTAATKDHCHHRPFQGNSRPQLRDRLIKVLPAKMRKDVIEATAILRLARAMNQGRREAVRDIRAISHDGKVTIHVKAAGEEPIWSCGPWKRRFPISGMSLL